MILLSCHGLKERIIYSVKQTGLKPVLIVFMSGLWGNRPYCDLNHVDCLQIELLRFPGFRILTVVGSSFVKNKVMATVTEL